jgi:hypothetical protein
MSTSQTTGLHEPVGTDKISVGTLGYLRARNRQRQYDVVIKELRQSGINQADLARRLGKAPEVISRLLARPGNWESDTFTDLLFGISGAVASYTATHPFSVREPNQIILGTINLAGLERTQLSQVVVTEANTTFSNTSGAPTAFSFVKPLAVAA